MSAMFPHVHAGVTKALCAAFPVDSEPSVCRESWVSEDECEVDGPGYAQCRVGDPVTGGRTRCINTFSGYKCDCGQGWVSATDPETGEEVCEDLNECLATSIPMKDPKCSCSRCACINLPGSFQCTGALEDKCTPKNNYNGCWRAKMDDGQVHHACKDSIVSYKNRASKGLLSANETWATCACPACFSPVKNTDSTEKACKPNCPMAYCSPQLGVCMPEPVPSKGRAAPGGGSSWGGTALAVLLSASLTCLVLYGIYSRYLHERMHSEMRDIMSQYMPLSDERVERRPGGRPDSGGKTCGKGTQECGSHFLLEAMQDFKYSRSASVALGMQVFTCGQSLCVAPGMQASIGNKDSSSWGWQESLCCVRHASFCWGKKKEGKCAGVARGCLCCIRHASACRKAECKFSFGKESVLHQECTSRLRSIGSFMGWSMYPIRR
ncbi:hypothetical protein DUNSADRAFT_12733 [Dunaliella salina]|uniref:EGF-like domain-containing protein n=1 Tax=Dunaliella salina TaxID=3046 RepID=A0ABQ7GAQ1_DUNSA|nr:hypothetical protein DUNSADRAFT_12733 [Dunaliella salina]|eukprot:KAF5831679.1 hypothetical protein DUNSADRAFT_12733 [Dunaliella salina]